MHSGGVCGLWWVIYSNKMETAVGLITKNILQMTETVE